MLFAGAKRLPGKLNTIFATANGLPGFQDIKFEITNICFEPKLVQVVYFCS
jgi:hypothetical protein